MNPLPVTSLRLHEKYAAGLPVKLQVLIEFYWARPDQGAPRASPSKPTPISDGRSPVNEGAQCALPAATCLRFGLGSAVNYTWKSHTVASTAPEWGTLKEPFK